MYNFTPYGQPGQPVRPSYNMLFSHFKQLGYSDELAGAEANRIMMQTNLYNQYNSQQTPNFQYNQNVYQNINYNASATQNLQYNNMYNQQPPVSTPTVQQNVQPKPPSHVSHTTPVKHSSFDKSNLLSGVKISSRPSMPQSNMNVSAAQTPTQPKNNLIKINLKSAPETKPVSKGFHDPIANQTAQSQLAQTQVSQNYQVPQSMTPQYPVSQPVLPPQHGYPLNHQMTPTYPYNQQMVQPPITPNMYYPNVPFTGMTTNKGSDLSNAFYIDTKGKASKKKTQASSKPDAPMTIDQVNKWIQDLYVHLNMTTCSKKLRKAVNVYIQYILEKFRGGSLTKNELRMLSPEEIMEFTPPSEKIEQVSDPEPIKGSVIEENNKNYLPITQTKGKKKLAKAKKTEEVVQKPRFDYSNKGLDANEMHKREQRSQRFKNTTSVPVYNFNLVKSKSIVGLSQELEKPYLRLTSEPNPLIVRPENVLVKSFKYMFDKFLDNKNYLYVQEQFRSIRQDIQVQHLRSNFVVNVYTTNARLALLHNDLDQFNQCQTQLKHLLNYFQDYQTVKAEFELYYILYLSLQNMNMGLLRYLKDNYVSSTESMNIDLNANEQIDKFKNSLYFKFANMVRMSIQDENFVEYFKLTDSNHIDYDHYLNQIYKQAFDSDSSDLLKKSVSPRNMDDVGSLFYCKLLFKMFESKFRMFSLYTLCRSSLTISPQILVTLLNFTDENNCLDFLREHNVVFNDSNVVDCKKTLSVILESPLMRSKKI